MSETINVDDRYYATCWNPISDDIVDGIVRTPDDAALAIVMANKNGVTMELLSSAVYAAAAAGQFYGLYQNLNWSRPWICTLQQKLLQVLCHCVCGIMFRPVIPYFSMVVNPGDFMALKYTKHLYGVENTFGTICPNVRCSEPETYTEKVNNLWFGYSDRLDIAQSRMLPIVQMSYTWPELPGIPKIAIAFNIELGECPLWETYIK